MEDSGFSFAWLVQKIAYGIFFIAIMFMCMGFASLDTGVPLIMGALLMIIISIILYLSPRFFYHIEYHTVNFGDFTTKVHNSFSGQWEISSSSMAGCDAEKFSVSGKSDSGMRAVKRERISPAYVKVTRQYYSVTDYFEVFYFSFDSQNNREAHEKEIIKQIEDSHEKSSTNHYSDGEKLIVFHCFTETLNHRFSAYPFSRSLVVRKAAKNVKFNVDVDEVEEKEFDSGIPDSEYLRVALAEKSTVFEVGDALLQISDENVLAYIARYSRNAIARGLAIRRVSDENALAEILMHADSHVVEDVVDKIHNQRLLCDIAKDARNDRIRYKAFENIRDDDLRQEVINHDR